MTPMMKKILTLVACLACLVPLRAAHTDTDSLRNVQIDELVIIATPKEYRTLREQPASSTRLTQAEMRARQVTGIKSLTAVVPNLFIPDYGSRLTTAVYIRGIGSRINTPAVGLYVDNIPYIDKSAFDFNYSDIEQVEILRGPQSTLYGRNTMGGLIKVHTKSPFTYQGTDVRLGAATYGDYNASLTHYHRISPRFAFSAGGFYEHQGGFFKNAYHHDKRIDGGDAGGGRLHFMYLPHPNLKTDLNISYEHSTQGAYPYYYIGGDDEANAPYLGRIAYNDGANYRRGLLNIGLNVEYQARKFIASFITGYQNLNDRMAMDQDFTPQDIFTLTQTQRSHTLSEEVVLKSQPGKQWQWTTGAFAFYQQLKTAAPVHFKRQGIQQVIEDNANSAFPDSPAAPTMHLSIYNDRLPISGDFRTPQTSAAVYHQSTWQLPWVEGLSVTAGLRLDYEKIWLDYASASAPMDFGFSLSMGPMKMEDTDLHALSSLTGEMEHDYLQLLPKVSVQYEWAHENSVYVTAAKGYRSGGYNIQMFSDLVQSGLKNNMKHALMESEVFGSMADMIDKMMPDEAIEVEATALYRPEYTWSYEAGTHLTLCDGRLTADAALFLMNTRDQQVSQFSDNGLGRITRNAGRSRSMGWEASLRLQPTRALLLNIGYGYTYAVFRDYQTVGEDNQTVNYRGRYIPFIPKHTLNAAAEYAFHLRRHRVFDIIRLGADYNAAGRLYWTEDNTASQSFYGTLNARLSLEKGRGAVTLWVRNVLDKDYATFYFQSLGNRFMQKGRPLQAGVQLRCRF